MMVHERPLKGSLSLEGLPSNCDDGGLCSEASVTLFIARMNSRVDKISEIFEKKEKKKKKKKLISESFLLVARPLDKIPVRQLM